MLHKYYIIVFSFFFGLQFISKLLLCHLVAAQDFSPPSLITCSAFNCRLGFGSLSAVC